ncbi:hypothetical protein [Providencia alcalifaciens]|uniref:hypothetical protein n=1 Tax=Providencia alcalifaciens TaxID=126385 RepID=UPI000586B7FF|nr:hypothetical protein [Providencia alcalifaciens]SPY74784.1 Uncharacterised protein [Providencia alcalifaciens]SQI38867.1 Uncharacterised protein [Providencia alcalifaciens]
MKIIVTSEITTEDREALFTGLRSYNQHFLQNSYFGQLGVYSKDKALTLSSHSLKSKVSKSCRFGTELNSSEVNHPFK